MQYAIGTVPITNTSQIHEPTTKTHRQPFQVTHASARAHLQLQHALCPGSLLKASVMLYLFAALNLFVPPPSCPVDTPAAHSVSPSEPSSLH